MSAALALLFAVQPDDMLARWECARSYRQGDSHFTVERYLREDGRFFSDEVHWVPITGTDGSASVHWRLGAGHSWSLRATHLWAEIGLSRMPLRPLLANLRIDGRLVGRIAIPPPSRRDRPRIMLSYSREPVRPGEVRAGPVPDLATAAMAVVTIEEEGGKVLGRARIPMPDWTVGRARVEEARIGFAADKTDHLDRCRDRLRPFAAPGASIP
jgi:hypothetical protein